MKSYFRRIGWRKIRFGERLRKDDERLRPSGGSCCLPGGWFPIPYYEVGEKEVIITDGWH